MDSIFKFNFNKENINIKFSYYMNKVRSNIEILLDKNELFILKELKNFYLLNNIEFNDIEIELSKFWNEIRAKNKKYCKIDKLILNENKEVNFKEENINIEDLKLNKYFGNVFKNIIIPNSLIFFIFLLFENYLYYLNKNKFKYNAFGNNKEKFNILNQNYDSIINYIDIDYDDKTNNYKGNVIFIMNQKNVVPKKTESSLNYNLKEINEFICKIDSVGNNLININDIKLVVKYFSLDYSEEFIQNQFKKINKKKYSYSKKEYIKKSWSPLDKKDILSEVNNYKHNNIINNNAFWINLFDILGVIKPKIIIESQKPKLLPNLFEKNNYTFKPDLSQTKNFKNNNSKLKNIKPLLFQKKNDIEANIRINETENIYEKVVQNLEEKEVDSQLENLVNHKFGIKSEEKGYQTVKFSTKNYFEKALNLSYKPELLKDKDNFFINLSNLKKNEKTENNFIKFNNQPKHNIAIKDNKNPVFKSHFKPQSVFALKLEQSKVTQQIKEENLIIDTWIPPYLYEFRDFVPNYDDRPNFKTRIKTKEADLNSFKESNYYYELELMKKLLNKQKNLDEIGDNKKKNWQNYIKTASRNQMIGNQILFPILEKGIYDNSNNEFFYKEDLFEFNKVPFKTFFKCLNSEDKHLLIGDNKK